MKKTILLLSLLLLISSCNKQSFEKKIRGSYYFKKIDLNAAQFIGKLKDTILENGICEMVVPDYVYAYGSNENVIIAKVHHTFGHQIWKVDSSRTDFYVIDLNNQIDNVYGPLKKYQFEDKLYALNGNLIEFDHVFSRIKK